MEITKQAEKLIGQIENDAKERMTYIKEKASKLAFMKKVNFQTGIIEQLIEEIESEKEPEGGDEPPPVSKTLATMSIRELAWLKGKEAARNESINRAKNKWNF